MFLTRNFTITNRRYTGQDDWGRNYMHGQTSSIDYVWFSSKYHSGNMFLQWILWEAKYCY